MAWKKRPWWEVPIDVVAVLLMLGMVVVCTVSFVDLISKS